MRRKKSNLGVTLLLLIVLAVVGGVVYLANSPMFERNKPVIEAPSAMFWNLRNPIVVTLKDDTGIKSYKVVLNDGKSSFEVANVILESPQKEVKVEIRLPRAGWNRRTANATMQIEARDASDWNMFKGNRATKVTQISIDAIRPRVNVLANSYKITQGGSALVVFGASDANLKEVGIHTSFGKVFKAEPFYKEGYYAALIAWPVTVKKFRAWVEAKDLADNVTKAHVPLYVERYRYRRSNITLKDRFLEGKVADLASQFDETANVADPVERFKIINEDIRKKNEDLIHKHSTNVSDRLIRRWGVKPFYPLKNAKKVASFGDHRFYYYKGKLVSESYHLGLDLASVKMADVRASNPGRVVFAGYNGIYGNMPLIDHGLGLYTLYGHCSTLYVTEGDDVRRNETIAKTGKTGMALGDHLHFGVLVQGIEVRPVEWMDAHWIRDNISNVFNVARKMIDRRDR
ncbi:M23 family metallopeptidase [Hydrogenimonas sp. SS33]|uniref:M23 family metallopeptidase n=1 Tax=Hydrogenimonas leucolamina TaxID=2954236 RepID=UPI00336C0D8A